AASPGTRTPLRTASSTTRSIVDIRARRFMYIAAMISGWRSRRCSFCAIWSTSREPARLASVAMVWSATAGLSAIASNTAGPPAPAEPGGAPPPSVRGPREGRAGPPAPAGPGRGGCAGSCVALIQDLEALEGEQLVGRFDRPGLGRDQRGQSAGRDAARREVD